MKRTILSLFGIFLLLSTAGIPVPAEPQGIVFRSGFESGPDGCPLELPADACGICGGNGSACACLAAQAVGYTTRGRTCNLHTAGDTPRPGLTVMPTIAIDEFTYNEFFSGVGYETRFHTGESRFGQPVDPNNPELGTVGRAHGCGACVQITGSEGSGIFMVREIADINAVGDNGLPRGVHIYQDEIPLIRDTMALGVDVTIQPVPCPVEGTIQLHQIKYGGVGVNWVASYFTPYNTVDPIRRIEIRAESFHDRWYPLPSSWTNRYMIGNYGFHDEDPDNDHGIEIPIPEENLPVRFRFTSLYGQVLVTEPIPWNVTDQEVYFDTGVQFEARDFTPGACEVTSNCGNFQLDEGEACEASLILNSDDCNPATCQHY